MSTIVLVTLSYKKMIFLYDLPFLFKDQNQRRTSWPWLPVQISIKARCHVQHRAGWFEQEQWWGEGEGSKCTGQTTDRDKLANRATKTRTSRPFTHFTYINYNDKTVPFVHHREQLLYCDFKTIMSLEFHFTKYFHLSILPMEPHTKAN